MKNYYSLSLIIALIFSFTAWSQECPQSLGTQTSTSIAHFKIDAGACNTYPADIYIEGSRFTKTSCNGTNLKYTLVPPDPEISNAVTFTTDFGAGPCAYVDSRLQTLSNVDVEFVANTQVYPNPVVSETSIKVRFQKEVSPQVLIFDLTGKVMISKTYENVDYLEIPTNLMNNGIYMLQIRTDQSKMTKKIVVMK